MYEISVPLDKLECDEWRFQEDLYRRTKMNFRITHVSNFREPLARAHDCCQICAQTFTFGRIANPFLQVVERTRSRSWSIRHVAQHSGDIVEQRAVLDMKELDIDPCIALSADLGFIFSKFPGAASQRP